MKRYALALGIVVGSQGAMAGGVPTPLQQFMEKLSFDRAFQKAREQMNLLGNDHFAITPSGVIKNDGVTSFRFTHTYDGVEVLGGLTVVDSDINGEQETAFQTQPLFVNTNPTLTISQALGIAKSELSLSLLNVKTSLKIMPREDRSGAELIYWVDYPSSITAPGGDLLIDAHSGKILANISKELTLAPIDVFTAKNQGVSFVVNRKVSPQGVLSPDSCSVTDMSTGQTKVLDLDACANLIKVDAEKNLCQLVDANSGTPIRINPEKCVQQVKNAVQVASSSDESVSNALKNSKQVLEYYLNIHGRDGYDAKGGASRSVVKIGVGYDNAAWIRDLRVMMYGEGDGVTFGDFTKNVEVAGHEMTHGVTSQTAKFTGVGESGALDEGYADFFGLMIANRPTWVMGEGMFLDQSARGIRDLKDPSSLDHPFLDEAGRRTTRPMPAHVKSKFSTFGRTCDNSNDRCYVHGNSTILSHALYLVHESLGREKAEKVIFQGLTRYMSETSNFVDAGAATTKACLALYDAATCDQVRSAFKAVGL